MPIIQETDFKNSIKEEKFSSLYFFYGEDNMLKHNYAKMLMKRIADDKLPELNVAKLDGKKMLLQNLADEVEQLPVMALYRVVMITDYDIGSLGENEFKDFKSIIENIPDSTILILLCDTVEVNVKKGKWASAIKSCEKFGSVLQCNYKRDADIIKYIFVWANKEKVHIDNSVARYLIECCGKDLQRLKGEVLKLCMYKKDSFITKEDIDRLSSKTEEATIYMLPKAIMQQNIASSLHYIGVLLDMRIKSIVILYSVIDNFIDVYRVKTAINDGKKSTDIAKDFGYAPNRKFVLTNAEYMAKKLAFPSLRKILDILSDADKSLKSSLVDERLLLEKTVISIIEIMRGNAK